MRFEVKKSVAEDYYIIWDTKLKQYYRFNGVLMRGSKVEVEKTTADLNRLQMTQQKLKKSSDMKR